MLDGPISVSLLPSPRATVSGVKFANMPGAKNPQMLEIKSVTVTAALLPLIGGNVEIGSVVIVEPRIALEVNAQGHANWDFAPAGASAKAADGKTLATEAGPSRAFSLGKLTVENGTLSYNDAKSNLSVAIDKVDISASLTSPGGASGPKPAATAPAGGAGKPIDTSAMHAFDATLNLTAASLVSSSLRLSNPDLSLVLKDGILTLRRLKVGVYGGSVDISGLVNSTQPALAIDMKGDVSNISVSEMLRQTSGSNQFGSTVKVTIDGKLSAKDITMKAAGTTADQIQRSMAGGAELGGYIFVGADKTLTAIGGVATGAAGGAIDKTLGSVMGATGQTGGVGAANLLNAISLVLNRFVNHDKIELIVCQ